MALSTIYLKYLFPLKVLVTVRHMHCIDHCLNQCLDYCLDYGLDYSLRETVCVYSKATSLQELFFSLQFSIFDQCNLQSSLHLFAEQHSVRAVTSSAGCVYKQDLRPQIESKLESPYSFASIETTSNILLLPHYYAAIHCIAIPPVALQLHSCYTNLISQVKY